MRASGSGGVLKYGHEIAARLGPWTIMRNDENDAFVFDAPIIGRDAFWIAQHPLSLIVQIGQAEWTWSNVAPAIDEVGGVRLVLSGRPIAAAL